MKKKIIYTDAPRAIAKEIKESVVVEDFFSDITDFERAERKEKITIMLNSSVLMRFKQYAKKYNMKYQTMINEVLSVYSKKLASKNLPSKAK